jgi:hypothetical protein
MICTSHFIYHIRVQNIYVGHLITKTLIEMAQEHISLQKLPILYTFHFYESVLLNRSENVYQIFENINDFN